MTHKFFTSIYNRLLMVLTAAWILYWMIVRLIARDVHGRLLRSEYIAHWHKLLLDGLVVPLSIYFLSWTAWVFFRWAFRDFLEVPER